MKIQENLNSSVIPPHKVAIVVNPNFGMALKALSESVHVWICDSEDNRIIADRIQADLPAGTGYSLERGVTIFRFDASATSQDVFLDIVDTVDEHHGEYSHEPAWSILEVYGVGLTPAVQDKLKSAFQCSVFAEKRDGFVAERTV